MPRRGEGHRSGKVPSRPSMPPSDYHTGIIWLPAQAEEDARDIREAIPHTIRRFREGGSAHGQAASIERISQPASPPMEVGPPLVEMESLRISESIHPEEQLKRLRDARRRIEDLWESLRSRVKQAQEYFAARLQDFYQQLALVDRLSDDNYRDDLWQVAMREFCGEKFGGDSDFDGIFSGITKALAKLKEACGGYARGNGCRARRIRTVIGSIDTACREMARAVQESKRDRAVCEALLSMLMGLDGMIRIDLLAVEVVSKAASKDDWTNQDYES